MELGEGDLDKRLQQLELENQEYVAKLHSNKAEHAQLSDRRQNARIAQENSDRKAAELHARERSKQIGEMNRANPLHNLEVFRSSARKSMRANLLLCVVPMHPKALEELYTYLDVRNLEEFSDQCFALVVQQSTPVFKESMVSLAHQNSNNGCVPPFTHEALLGMRSVFG
jgi:hypothetical protein